ncbi:hypothetical protein BS50DRAFT_341668 [Corynespora cassiicola Philippines]|uniref:RNA polymerase II subunit B1 CTD phosphatase RPAP2 homolog n=1 Tax=Corynespora cassiicola Philippines TaxID=1448308 RepID=A0A2T2NVM9_CORCC|nr:hypothetical protein BS50DRAFT_341668 [Corynespora cassiicola Philippines]
MAPPPPAIVAHAPGGSGADRAPSKRQLDAALHHANLLQQRKDVEKQVLDAIITLMDFPPSPTADPKRPSPADALRFTESMVPFQPADYDSLIEERNIVDKCGYALCPRPKRKAPSRAKKHFIDTEHGVEIVDRKVLEVWCSDDCARRALYVKVQLNEEPAWMRQGGYKAKIELMVDNTEEHRTVLPIRLKNDAPPKPAADQDEDDEEAAWALREDALATLALERGEKPGQLSKASDDILQSEIKERVATGAPVAPSPANQDSQAHLAIEGHVPRADKQKKTKHSDDDDDDESEDGADWDKHLPI